MKNIIRPPDNDPINSLVSYLAGIFTGIFIDRKFLRKPKFKRQGCVILEQTDNAETEENVSEDETQQRSDDSSEEENGTESFPDQENQ